MRKKVLAMKLKIFKNCGNKTFSPSIQLNLGESDYRRQKVVTGPGVQVSRPLA